MSEINSMNKKGKILIVEDSKETLELFEAILTRKGYIVITATNGKKALDLVNSEKPEIILLDIMMPEMNGFEVCKHLKKNPKTASIPVIFISALQDEKDKVKGFEVGGVDYITKPLKTDEILVRIKHQLTIVRLQEQLMMQNEQLQKSEKHLLTIVNSMSDGIVIINQQGKIIYVNPAAQGLWGKNAAQLVGQELKIPEKIDEVGEIEIQQAKGTIIVAETRTEEIIWENKPAYLISLIDITKRKETEVFLQKAKEAAERANLAKSAFIASISHELRTPLNSILGFAQLLLNDSQLNSKQQEYINIINSSGKNLLSLINDVLEISKIEAGGIKISEKSFNLHELLGELEDMLEIKAKQKELELIFDYKSKLPRYIQTDETKLRQILIKILSNSIKFTDKGKVSLRGFIAQTKTKPITICFEVEDTGQGIAEQEMHFLFETFQQTNRTKNQEGTGLGLSLSQEFAKALGGEIRVTSTVGKGSIFRLFVPVKLSDLSAIAKSQTSAKVLRLAPNQPECRILVIDDDQENGKLLNEMLSPLGFQVKIANNGKEVMPSPEADAARTAGFSRGSRYANAYAEGKTFAPPLILIDLKMLLMDGESATQLIKKYHNQASKIIAFTVNAVEEQQALQAGCDDFVSKPCQENILLDKIAHHLNVSYIFEEKIPLTFVDSKTESLSNIRVMPHNWLVSLHHSAAGADPEQIMSLLEGIPPKHTALKKAIADLVDNFAFDKIMDLTQPFL